MAAPIGPGDWVERIRPPKNPSSIFQVGKLFIVEEISEPTPCEKCDGCPGLLFRGVPRPSDFAAHRAKRGSRIDYWAACAYRPIYRPRADLIESLKHPIDAMEEA